PTLPATISGPGHPKVGDTLTITGGSFVDGGGSPSSIQWLSCAERLCLNIGGATGSSYVVDDFVVGTAIQVEERVTTSAGTAANQSAPTAVVSMTATSHANGRIFWTTQGQPVHYSIGSMLPPGRSGQHLTVPQPAGISTQPAVSPDGTVVASVNVNNSNHIELMNADGSGVVDLGVSGLYPTWSPDQSRVAFVGPDGIHSTDGKHDVLLIPIPTGNLTGPIAWSPDGSRIAFSYIFPGQTDFDIAVASADGRGPIAQLTSSPTQDDQGLSWSPTGDRIAFKSSPHSGNGVDADLYVMNADGSNQTLLYHGKPVSSTTFPAAGSAWSPDATTILFSSITGNGWSQLFTIPVSGGVPTPLPGEGPENDLMSWALAV